MMKMKMFTMLCFIFGAPQQFRSERGGRRISFRTWRRQYPLLAEHQYLHWICKLTTFYRCIQAWMAVFYRSPLAYRLGIYTNGAKIFVPWLLNLNHAAHSRKSIWMNLMAVHDQRIKYLDGLNQVLVQLRPQRLYPWVWKPTITLRSPGKIDINKGLSDGQKAVDLEKNQIISCSRIWWTFCPQIERAMTNHKGTVHPRLPDCFRLCRWSFESSDKEKDKSCWKQQRQCGCIFHQQWCSKLWKPAGYLWSESKPEQDKSGLPKQVINVMQMLKCTEEEAYFVASKLLMPLNLQPLPQQDADTCITKKGDMDKSVCNILTRPLNWNRKQTKSGLCI